MTQLQPILIAEDSVPDAELIQDALVGLDLANEIVWVRDGAEALDFLNRRGEFAARPAAVPVVVLLDLKMPRVDGLEALAQIRAEPELRDLPVVIVTSSHEERDLVEGYRLGANAYVVKPVDADQFRQAVRSVGAFWALVNQPPPRPAESP